MNANIIKSLLLLSTIVCFSFSYSQEPLPDILQRGYISQWLLCGPFTSDLEGGIKSAIRDNEAPLGTRDFWSGVGGIGQLLPQPGEKTQIDGINYTWLPFYAKSPRLDFQSLQPPDECIYYLSAYVQVPEDQIIYINMQTPLGARLWISKTKIRDVKSMSIEHSGIDRALVRLRKGLNLIVLEIPFVSIQSISKITKIPVDSIPTKLWSQKEPHIGTTGYEISFHIRPVESAGSIYYVPLLEPSRKFTGPEIDPKQVFYLTLYNPTPKQIFPVNINGWLMPQNFSLGNQQVSLQPQEEIRFPLQIPNKGRKANDKANARILITAPDENGESKTSEFTSPITFTEPEPLSKTYLVTGTWGKGDKKEEPFQYLQQRVQASKTQIWNAYENTDFGTDIGTSNIWLNVLQQSPDMLTSMRETMRRGKSSLQNIYSPIDERLLSTESILMNILIGTKLKESLLKEFNKSFVAWDYPYLTPQTAQILHKCNFNGVITNISPQVLPSLAYWREPGGDSILLRILQTPPPFYNHHEIKKWAFISHSEVADIIPEIDILVLENTSPHFNVNLLPELKNEIPPFYFHGNGASEFFEEIQNFLNSRGNVEKIPNVFSPVHSMETLNVLSNALLKTYLYQFEENLLLAQTSATIAGIFGMSYPGELIARLWTILLQTADPDVINSKLTENEVKSLTSQLCIAINDTEKIIQRTIKHIAENVNTLTHVTDNKPNSQAIVVFNPNSSIKTLPVIVEVSIPNLNFALVSSGGKPVPCQIYTFKEETSSIPRYQVEFVAEEIPAYGIKNFYLIPDKRTFQPIKTQDNFIENEYLLVRINNKTGNISQIIDKTSGKDIIPPESNFDEIGWMETDNGSFIPFSDTVSKYETFKSDLLQRVIIQYENNKGNLTKEYCLYPKVNQIYCYHRFTPSPEVMVKNLVSSFETIHEGAVPIYGSQSFAFMTPPSDYRLDSNIQNKNHLFFAHHFFAYGRGDYIKNESDSCVPLTNICFIKSEEGTVSVLQNLIKKTLWNRGIPSKDISIQDWVSAKAKSNFYIWTGTQKDYENIKQLITETSPSLNSEIIKRSEVGTPFLIEISGGDFSYSILGFIANTPDKLGAVINNFLNMLNQRGEILIPSAITNMRGADIPQLGFALMFNGTKLVLQNSNKTFYLYHGKIDAHNQGPNINSIPIHYRIYPFSEHWLQTDIIQQGNEKPLLSTTTGLHGGTWANNTSFLSMDNPKIEISSIKPMGTGIPLIQSGSQNPSDMFIVRLNSTSHQKQNGTLSSTFTINNIQSLTPLESLENPSINLKEQAIDFNPWEIQTCSVSLKKVTAPNRVPFDMTDIYYTDGNKNTYPLQIIPENPVLKISPVNTSSSTNIQLTVSNINANETIQGIVFLESSENCILKTTQIPYNLPPLTIVQHTIPYEKKEESPEIPEINAWTEVNGKIVRSFLYDKDFPARVRLEKDVSQVKIIVENPLPVALYGNITWFSLQYAPNTHQILFNKYMKPAYTELFVKPYETNTYTFLPQDTSLSASPVACIQINSRVQYLSIQ